MAFENRYIIDRYLINSVGNSNWLSHKTLVSAFLNMVHSSWLISHKVLKHSQNPTLILTAFCRSATSAKCYLYRWSRSTYIQAWNIRKRETISVSELRETFEITVKEICRNNKLIRKDLQNQGVILLIHSLSVVHSPLFLIFFNCSCDIYVKFTLSFWNSLFI